MTIDIVALAKEADCEIVIITGSDDSDIDDYRFTGHELGNFATLLEAEIRKEYEARITGLEDALDHIKKIAGMARVPTKRLDWIEARASMALLNEPWDKDYRPLPKNANSSRNTLRHLTEQNTKLMEALADIANGHVRNVTNIEQCSHGKYGYEYCETCLEEFAEAALTPQPEKEGTE